MRMAIIRREGMRCYAIFCSDPAKCRDRIIDRRVNKRAAQLLADRLNRQAVETAGPKAPLYYVVRQAPRKDTP